MIVNMKGRMKEDIKPDAQSLRAKDEGGAKGTKKWDLLI